MQHEWLNLTGNAAEDAYTAMKKLNETNIKTAQKLFEQQTEMLTDSMEFAQSGMEKLSAVKNPKDLASLQNELLRNYGEKMLGNYQSVVSVFNEAHESLGGLVEDNLKTAEANIKKAVSTNKKAA